MRKRTRWMLAGGSVAALLVGCCLLPGPGRVVSTREGDLSRERTFALLNFHTVRAEACPGAAYSWKVRRRPDPWGDSDELEFRYPGGKTVRIRCFGGFQVDEKPLAVKVLSEGVVLRRDGSVALEPLKKAHPGIVEPLPVEESGPPG